MNLEEEDIKSLRRKTQLGNREIIATGKMWISPSIDVEVFERLRQIVFLSASSGPVILAFFAGDSAADVDAEAGD
jgi:hypothetical protein